MLLNEIPFQDVIPIQGYGENNFKINNKYYEGGIFIFTNIICKWNGFNDFSLLMTALWVSMFLLIAGDNIVFFDVFFDFW